MRKNTAIKNGAWASISYALIFVLALISRQAFLSHFDNALLGYSGVIANVFSLISVAELGVGTVISYGLYQQLQKKDEEEIAILMMIYKWIYRVIGIVVLAAGIICFFFLPLIITDANTNWQDVHWIYAIELINAVLIYFMTFRRLLFTADQKEYKCVQIESAIQIIAYVIRIVLAFCTQMYILYLAMGLIANVIANALICVMADRFYPFAKYRKISYKDIQKRGILKEVGSYGLQKISIAVYGGIDNIAAMRFLGPYSVVLMMNYETIESGASSFINKLLSGFQPSIGDYVYDESQEQKAAVFHGLNLLSFMIAAFVAVSYCTLFQPFISMWLGGQYLLPYAYVIFFSINQYIGWNHRMLGYFRSAIGKFNEDQWYMAASAVLNVVLSIVWIQLYGLPGVIAATCIGHLIQWTGRSHVVFTNIFHAEEEKKYWLKQFGLAVLAAAEVLLSIGVCRMLPEGILSFILRVLVCLILPNCINILVLWRMKDFSFVKETMKEMLAAKRRQRQK
jgi:O-antigen/teichoic acid export membrane protein